MHTNEWEAWTRNSNTAHKKLSKERQELASLWLGPMREKTADVRKRPAASKHKTTTMMMMKKKWKRKHWQILLGARLKWNYFGLSCCATVCCVLDAGSKNFFSLQNGNGNDADAPTGRVEQPLLENPHRKKKKRFSFIFLFSSLSSLNLFWTLRWWPSQKEGWGHEHCPFPVCVCGFAPKGVSHLFLVCQEQGVNVERKKVMSRVKINGPRKWNESVAIFLSQLTLSLLLFNSLTMMMMAWWSLFESKEGSPKCRKRWLLSGLETGSLARSIKWDETDWAQR